MSSNRKEVVSFKADGALLEALQGVRNRSAFIRDAILAALDSTCPLCSGSGTLTPNQMKHWQELAADHSIERCEHCSEIRIVCSNRDGSKGDDL
ncbi:MAG: CopG family transcriptional regulator [Candidatus Eisenbacteria bacterium]|nr:CopG family transcriptional regulator [Candidatus Eisenbacteria bacterium]